MNFLIDTNIISEIAKQRRCDPHVASWYASIEGESLYLSVLVTGEIRKGIELARRREPAKAASLERWLQEVYAAFGDRIPAVDRAAGDEWGRMSAERPIPVVEGLLAATEKVHDMVLVTRNDADVLGLGARVLNPFKAGATPSIG